MSIQNIHLASLRNPEQLQFSKQVISLVNTNDPAS